MHNQEVVYCKKGLPQEKQEPPFFLRALRGQDSHYLEPPPEDKAAEKKGNKF